MATTAPLFDDLPPPAAPRAPPIRYVPRCMALRTAQYFARELVTARDARRKTECYLNMIAAILGKDKAQ